MKKLNWIDVDDFVLDRLTTQEIDFINKMRPDWIAIHNPDTVRTSSKDTIEKVIMTKL